MISSSKKNRLDRIFSIYVRLRDTDSQGYGSCISCNRYIHYSDSDAGHFVSRDRMTTRWNEKNVHLQCRNCNRFRSGEQYSQSLNIQRRYGDSAPEILLAESHKTSKMTDFEVEALIQHYRAEAKKLIQSKNFDVKI